jgi:hypothetical protein
MAADHDAESGRPSHSYATLIAQAILGMFPIRVECMGGNGSVVVVMGTWVMRLVLCALGPVPRDNIQTFLLHDFVSNLLTLLGGVRIPTIWLSYRIVTLGRGGNSCPTSGADPRIARPEGKTLKEIYAYLEEQYAYFRQPRYATSWRSSIRHNLCSSRLFKKTVVFVGARYAGNAATAWSVRLVKAAPRIGSAGGRIAVFLTLCVTETWHPIGRS